MAPLVSLVLPAFNEGLRLPPFLARLATQLAPQRAPAVELLVVDDGSREEDLRLEREAVERASAVLRAAGSPHRVRLVAAERNRGKGAAIRRGWAEAAPEARWLGFLDADGAIDAPELARVLRLLEQEGQAWDVLAGSRVRMAGRRVERLLFRHLQGRLFATLAELQLGLGFYDTQCGFKLFRASLLRPCLPELCEETWLLDLEVLALLRADGARCLEVPIDWAEPGGSKVRLGRDAVRMYVGLSRIQRRLAARTPRVLPAPLPEAERPRAATSR